MILSATVPYSALDHSFHGELSKFKTRSSLSIGASLYMKVVPLLNNSLTVLPDIAHNEAKVDLSTIR